MAGMFQLTEEQIAHFDRDGFVIAENLLNRNEIDAARARFEPLFAGEFATGIGPDEMNWKEGRDPPGLARQMCNGWKADPVIASIVLRPDIGRACATLKGWAGARINQDNVIWKPPGAKALGFHQDDSYEDWIVPPELCTCWITLDDTRADQGTIEYVRGSHRWPVAPKIRQFHAPADPLDDMKVAAAARPYQIVPIEAPAGSAVFHHGRTWHGSRANRGDNPRRSVVTHCMSAEAEFHPTAVSEVYSRYKRRGSLAMDEAFFPILWRQDGYRTAWLDEHVSGLF